LVETMPSLHIQWQEILMVVAILSFGIGNIVAIAQTNIKRMLAYSSIAHMGYMSLGLLTATQSGYAAALFYLFIYTLMSMGVFAVIGAYYYLYIVKVMYFEEPVGDMVIESTPSMRIALTVNSLAVLALGLFPSALIDLCRAAV